MTDFVAKLDGPEQIQPINGSATILFADTTINQGGLIRCCLATIHEYVDAHITEHVPAEPLVISCRYEADQESGNIILEGGVWRWNHE